MGVGGEIFMVGVRANKCPCRYRDNWDFRNDWDTTPLRERIPLCNYASLLMAALVDADGLADNLVEEGMVLVALRDGLAGMGPV